MLPLCPPHSDRRLSHYLVSQMSRPQTSLPWPPLARFFLSLLESFLFRVLIFHYVVYVCYLSRPLNESFTSSGLALLCSRPSSLYPEYYPAQSSEILVKEINLTPKDTKTLSSPFRKQHFPNSSNPWRQTVSPRKRRNVESLLPSVHPIVPEPLSTLHQLECLTGEVPGTTLQL